MFKTIDAAIAKELSSLGYKPEDKVYGLMFHRLKNIALIYAAKGRPWQWSLGETWDEYAKDLKRLFGPEL